jgi:hypothetical protein
MSQFLDRYLPNALVRVVMASWYVALLAGILYCALEPAADFRYTRL